MKMLSRSASYIAGVLFLLTFASVTVPSVAVSAVSCGAENINCHDLAYCENITVGGVKEPTCVCPAGTIGSENYLDNDPPFTSGICNKDLWTVRYVKTASAFGEWRTCAASQKNGGGHYGSGRCTSCTGQLRYGRDDITVDPYPGPWWTVLDVQGDGVNKDCMASTFGISTEDDPYAEEYKACDCRELVELPSPMWNKCAEEDGECTCDGLIVYGTLGSANKFKEEVSDGVAPVPCTNGHFNDPDRGVYKACYCFEGVDRTLPENPAAVFSSDSGYGMCEGNAGGYYLRKLGDKLEVNCLYDNKTLAEVEAELYSDDSYTVEARVYRWVLPTTSEPIEIPPTGLTVDRVSFDTSCAESGCWVIEGTMTTGEAFNDFTVFNTFFLPQAEGNSTLSYDFDYSASGSNVDWTFAPADHPCTSVNYDADDETAETFRVSYCCIDKPDVGPSGGFVANYRPTQNFVDWTGERCDKKFISTSGQTKCWKAMGTTKDTWLQAHARCLVAGGSLPSIASEEENNFLLDLAREKGMNGSVWIGATNRTSAVDNEFTWTDGSTFGYNKWGVGNPDGFTRTGSSWELCAGEYVERTGSTTCLCNGAVRYGGRKNGEYQWNTKTAAEVQGSIECSNSVFGDPAQGVKKDCFCQETTTAGCAEMYLSDGSWNDDACSSQNAENTYFCQFAETDCLEHVVQRPGVSAPVSTTAPCWTIQNSAKNYPEAEDVCKANGGTLAVVDDAEKFHLMKRMLDMNDVQEAWIGLDDIQNEGTFLWVNTTALLNPSDFSGWKVSNPRSYVGTGDNMDCVLVQEEGKWWVDADCNAVKKFVCEIPREGAICDSDGAPDEDSFWSIPFPVNYDQFMIGKFKGMDASPGVVKFENLDPYFGQFSFEIRLDEVELRSKAGLLRGTVGVEYTIDTYLGLSNFRPTGLQNGVIDTFSTQTALHLEKTNFFSVSTHGVNAYTFLEYVNMRLIMVLDEDSNFSGDSEAADRTVRTNRTGNAAYVQVTFTMGAQYQPNPLSGGLIPLDSVRSGRGTFIGDTDLDHVCDVWDTASSGDPIGLTSIAGLTGTKQTFLDLTDNQPCAPKSQMCISPASVPDQFVSFNIPLGFEVFDNQASSSLENNIFVDMVINALDTDPSTGGTAGPTPNQGNDPMQMKTTLTASIPIVAGGINIFCDGITAKTDLKDVANADIIVGSANSLDELSRLRIIQDIASTNLAEVASQPVDSDSIEAGLMTLVLKGDSAYFTNGLVNSKGYSLELDDVITIHLMTDGEAPSESDTACESSDSIDCQLRDLLAQAPDDNSDINGLDTNGYGLNGAFKFDIEREDGIALLEPTSDLLSICPFNPTRPSGGLPLESCITRRDVRSREYPTRSGAAGPTAMEILAKKTPWTGTDDVSTEYGQLDGQVAGACACATEASCCEAGFMQMILGANDYARGLAVDFVKAIDEHYTLNGRYTRAYWINPGYEWTPTQTAGKSIFSVSQKVYLFALITLDENIGSQRRRMLLATDVDPTQNTGSGPGAASLSFPVARSSIMAQAFDVPADKAVVFNVEMQLTEAEACMTDTQFVESTRQTFLDYLENAASAFHTVQVLGFTRSLNGVSCGRRRVLRKLLADFSAASAAVQMLIVYKDAGGAMFNDQAFASMPGITSVDVDSASASNVKVDATFVNEDGASPKKASDSKSGGSDNTALIAGIAGGVGGAVVMAAGVLVYMRSRKTTCQTAEPVQTINVADLKAQLSNDV